MPNMQKPRQIHTKQPENNVNQAHKKLYNQREKGAREEEKYCEIRVQRKLRALAVKKKSDTILANYQKMR